MNNSNNNITQEELAEQLYQIYHISLGEPFIDWKELRKDLTNREGIAWALVAKQAEILLLTKI